MIRKVRTSAPMSLDAMRTFALAQLAHYTELIAVLDKIKVDPLSVLPQAQRRRGRRPAAAAPARPGPTRRRRRRAAVPVDVSPTASAYARQALRKLGVATVKEIVAHAKRAGWGTISKTPDVVMTIELKKLVTSKVLRRVTHKGQRVVRYAMATPSKAAAKNLADAQALFNGTPALPGAPAPEVVN